MATVDQWIARANIEHLRRRLAEEPDHAERQVIVKLLAEEEVKLELALRKARDGTNKA